MCAQCVHVHVCACVCVSQLLPPVQDRAEVVLKKAPKQFELRNDLIANPFIILHNHNYSNITLHSWLPGDLVFLQQDCYYLHDMIRRTGQVVKMDEEIILVVIGHYLLLHFSYQLLY